MGIAHGCQSNASHQITDWWQEAEQAARSGRLARARRFLRWIVICCPEEEEGWLYLAHLTADSQEQIPILKNAYRFHPESQRVQAALREARRRHLESAVGELKPRRAIPRCLPAERQLSPGANGATGNGHGPKPEPQSHPLKAVTSDRPWPLAALLRLRRREPAARGGDGQGGTAWDPSSGLDASSS